MDTNIRNPKKYNKLLNNSINRLSNKKEILSKYRSIEEWLVLDPKQAEYELNYLLCIKTCYTEISIERYFYILISTG